jgi:hypothetical protein
MVARASSLHSAVVVSKNSVDSSDATSPHTGGQVPGVSCLLANKFDRARVKRDASGRLISGKEKAPAVEKTKAKRPKCFEKTMVRRIIKAAG